MKTTALSRRRMPLGPQRPPRQPENLWDLIADLGEATDDDAEVVNTAWKMIRSGRVRRRRPAE